MDDTLALLKVNGLRQELDASIQFRYLGLSLPLYEVPGVPEKLARSKAAWISGAAEQRQELTFAELPEYGRPELGVCANCPRDLEEAKQRLETLDRSLALAPGAA